ncbi:MAG: dephospho-CoA kinase [Rhodothermia bacterium]|nr:MAG: dephospho-CoA kinase [Rhodothermia bacterium]
MKVVGVTGGIGSGKSTVCKQLEKRGARVFYADEVARDLMVSDPHVRARIESVLGPEAYSDEGSLERKYIADRIFSSDEDRAAINRIVHPAVGEAFRRFVSKAREEGVGLVVKEAALLLDNDTSDLDVVLVIDAPKEVQIKRIATRDGYSIDEIEARMAGQMSPAEMVRGADHVIRNDGTYRELKRAVDELVNEWVA